MSQRLYHEYVEGLPLIDYHNHLSISDIDGNRNFNDLTELWLLSDPYKHRAMRICGVDEKYITGNSTNYEKFRAWCEIFPTLIGNPLYHWSTLELKRIFGIILPINSDTAEEIWNTANKMLHEPEFSAKGLLDRFNVEYSAPCAEITSDISPFMSLAGVAPSLRGDDLLPVSVSLIRKLEKCTGVKIDTLNSLAKALSIRLDEFHNAGCRFSDHALDNGFCYVSDDGCNEKRFDKLLKNGFLDDPDMIHINSAILRVLGGEYAKRNWVMQLHIGALRYTSSRLRQIVGPLGGFAGIGSCCVTYLTEMLNDIEKGELGLPRTVLFTLNPSDNAVLSVLSGSFCQNGVRGKVQQGPAWWWCDHLYGMREVFESISSYGVLSTFIGMTTDSRSLLSFVRHEYFRRAVCGWIGEKVEKGEFPDNFEELGRLVTAICYGNAKNILTESGL